MDPHEADQPQLEYLLARVFAAVAGCQSDYTFASMTSIRHVKILSTCTTIPINFLKSNFTGQSICSYK